MPPKKKQYQRMSKAEQEQVLNQSSPPQYQQRYRPRQGHPGRGGHHYQPRYGGGGGQLIPHLDNLQQLDQPQLEGLLLQLIQSYGPEIADIMQSGQMKQNNQMQNRNYQGMPMSYPYQYPPPQMQPPPMPQPNQFSQMPQTAASGQSFNLSSQTFKPQAPNQFRPPQPQVSQYGIQQNLCEKHFPEPILYFKERPLCKKCVPDYLSQMKKNKERSLSQYQTDTLAKMLGINTMALNAYQSEKMMVSSALEKIDDLDKNMAIYMGEFKEREELADKQLTELPELMSGMFDKVESLLHLQEEKFYLDLRELVKKQQEKITNDIQNKVPNFTQRLAVKYQQLQMADASAAQKSVEDQVQVFEHYLAVFTDLDAEFEKYFNEFESIGKLERLFDKDPNEVVKDFSDLVERNLRLDYNIKNNFIPNRPHRLHSFQWNQRNIQIYKVKTSDFEKKLVTMDFEVPLYSRSIATETANIYLIGGYIKRANKYLNTCHKYDELFGYLHQKASLKYARADHSLCVIEGFIYVVGTFVNNQVYGYCEKYDTQKDKWKDIAALNVPRSGVSLCAFQNQYLFAFGGRIDQKKIVDTIECYDVKRNLWQLLPNIDKKKWVPAYMGVAYQITDKEIMIFGGKSALTFQIFNGCFVMDLEKMSISEKGNLVNPCSFMNTPMVFNHCLYAFGNDIYIHRYSIPEQKWSCVAKQFQ